MPPPRDDSQTPAITAWERRNLKRAYKYRVIQAFIDADGIPHLAGEEWLFNGSKFSRFENEYLLSVRIGPDVRWIRLSCDADQQDRILRHFTEYVTPI